MLMGSASITEGVSQHLVPARRPIPPERAGPALRSLAQRTESLPSAPAITLRVMNLASSGSTPIEELASLIELDQGLAAAVLRAANQPDRLRRRQIGHVLEAVRLLGLGQIAKIATQSTSVALTSRMTGAEQLLWQHALASGLGAAIVSRRWAPEARALAHAAGLMHDAGRAVLHAQHALGDDAEQAQRSAGLTDVERYLLGFTHTDVGAELTRAWDLPEAIEEAALLHHDPDFAQRAPSHARVVASVIVGCHLAEKTGLGVKSASREESLVESAMRLLEIPPSALPGAAAELEYTHEVRWMRRFGRDTPGNPG